MVKMKKIPCRVCGKPFKPCGYCQSHADTFKWRNFACSRECAEKYISATTAYRNSSKEVNHTNGNVIEAEPSTIGIDSDEKYIIRRKCNKKKSANDAETINEERERID